MTSWKKPLLVAAVTTLVVTTLAYLLPEQYAATGVGLGFLCASYWAALHRQPAGSRHYGMSLGGVLDPEPLDGRRIARESAVALGWGLGMALLIFPLFWIGYQLWWRPHQPFIWPVLPRLADDVLGQLLVIALPEEAFFRGYLQTALDDGSHARRRIFGASLGPGILIASAIFALGHLLTELHPNRLAVFFPALLFGWLRVRTGGIGASIVFHAACNVFASFLARGYGLAH